jgi:hydroxymethylpyrimidine kinase/phosphomethylpyrimidine kinase
MGSRPNVLSIAGCDPSGGAGIAADLKTFAAFDVYGMAVVSALTAQNTRAVYAIHQPPLDVLDQQLRAVLSDVTVHGVKIGMLGNAESALCVAGYIQHYSLPHIVLDPVVAASTGAALGTSDMSAALLRHLVPLCDVITPNGPEIAALTGLPAPMSEAEQITAGQVLLRFGARAVVVKGGHSQGDEAVDVLVREGDVRRFARPRQALGERHGTGCTLSSALAAGLALGWPLEVAVERAKDYVFGALLASDQLAVGSGAGPLDHGWRSRSERPI